MAELGVKMRLSPVTDQEQSLVNLVGPGDGDVDVEYATIEIFGGRSFPVGDGVRPRVRPFGGLAAGVGLLQLSQTGVEPYNDDGLSASGKLGLDVHLGDASRFALRLQGRYQILSAAVDIPNDVIVQLGVNYALGSQEIAVRTTTESDSSTSDGLEIRLRSVSRIPIRRHARRPSTHHLIHFWRTRP